MAAVCPLPTAVAVISPGLLISTTPLSIAATPVLWVFAVALTTSSLPFKSISVLFPEPDADTTAPMLGSHNPPAIKLLLTVIVVFSLVKLYTPSFKTLSSTYAVSFASTPKIGAVKESLVWLSGSRFSTLPAKPPCPSFSL